MIEAGAGPAVGGVAVVAGIAAGNVVGRFALGGGAVVAGAAGAAAIGLGLLGDKQLVPDLIDMLAEARGLSSQAAISSALGFIGDARSIGPLIDMLNDSEKTDLARAFAAVALGIVADKEELPWNSKISVNSNYRANTQTLTDQAGTGILDIL